jgi:tetratricopeptide (TPR) repeat protein
MTRTLQRLTPAVLMMALAACASRPPAAAVVPPAPPKYPDYPAPVVPADLTAAAEIVTRHQRAWSRLQAGDLRGASREFTDILRKAPEFYPAETGLGFAALADREYASAAKHFAAASERDARYLPAWIGRAEAELALGDDASTIVALERVVVLDPNRDDVKSRLELLRFRELQSLIETGQRARQAGRYPEAVAAFQRALERSPASRAILRELAVTERDAGMLDLAEAHVRSALAIDARDAEAYALLAGILERQARFADAAAAMSRALALDPRPEWRERRDSLEMLAAAASIPVEVRALPSAESVTRAQAAAYIGVQLEALLARAPRRVAAVATDVRDHWAAPWILAVTQAGVMDVFANHTFQPGNAVRRGDLARIVAQLLPLLPKSRQSDVSRWRGARPRFADLPAGNLFYPAAALASASGAMNAEDERFFHTRPATGREVAEAIARVAQLAGR